MGDDQNTNEPNAGAIVSNADLLVEMESLRAMVKSQGAQLASMTAPQGNVQDTSRGIVYPPAAEDEFLANGLPDTILIAPHSANVGIGLLPATLGETLSPIGERQKIPHLRVCANQRWTRVGSEWYPLATFVDLKKDPQVTSSIDKRATDETLVAMAKANKLYDKTGQKVDGFMLGSEFVALVRMHINLKRQRIAANEEFERAISTPQEKAMGKPAALPTQPGPPIVPEDPPEDQ